MVKSRPIVSLLGIFLSSVILGLGYAFVNQQANEFLFPLLVCRLEPYVTRPRKS